MSGKRGRPAAGGSGVKTTVRVTLDCVTIETLRTIGKGNLSAGIRIAADILKTIRGEK